MSLVIVVTGASRGVGRGVAAELATAGHQVFGTGRSIAGADLPAAVTRIVCDHTDDADVTNAFAQIGGACGRIDVLVNAAWGGYERMVEEGRFTWSLPFWEQPRWRWASMLDAGVRAAFVASQEAVPLMLGQRHGLIVHLSYWAAQKHIGNVIYGVAKAATDKLAADTAVELREHGIASVSLYPGLVRTEAVLAAGAFDLSNSESPEFIGRVIAGLYASPRLMDYTGRVLVAAAIARELGIVDLNGASPEPLSLSTS